MRCARVEGDRRDGCGRARGTEWRADLREGPQRKSANSDWMRRTRRGSSCFNPRSGRTGAAMRQGHARDMVASRTARSAAARRLWLCHRCTLFITRKSVPAAQYEHTRGVVRLHDIGYGRMFVVCQQQVARPKVHGHADLGEARDVPIPADARAPAAAPRPAKSRPGRPTALRATSESLPAWPWHGRVDDQRRRASKRPFRASSAWRGAEAVVDWSSGGLGDHVVGDAHFRRTTDRVIGIRGHRPSRPRAVAALRSVTGTIAWIALTPIARRCEAAPEVRDHAQRRCSRPPRGRRWAPAAPGRRRATRGDCWTPQAIEVGEATSSWS